MKKKILGVLLFVFSALLLVGCSLEDDLSGKWYNVDAAGDKVLKIDIQGDSGKLYFEGNHSITGVDRKHKTFSFTDGHEYVVSYSIDEDVITVDYGNYVFSGSSESTYYREGSEALKKAIEEEKNN